MLGYNDLIATETDWPKNPSCCVVCVNALSVAESTDRGAGEKSKPLTPRVLHYHRPNGSKGHNWGHPTPKRTAEIAHVGDNILGLGLYRSQHAQGTNAPKRGQLFSK